MYLQKLDRRKHDLSQVSELIYETDQDTFNFFFKNKANTSRILEKLVNLEGYSLGYQNIYVVMNSSQQILGIMVCWFYEKFKMITEFKLLLKNLNFLDAFKFIVIEILDGIFLADLKEDDYYLAAIAVEEQSRNQGIGNFILKQGIELARQKGCKRVVLDVDIANDNALRFYERFGFKKFKKKTISLFGKEKGLYNMEFLLS